MSDTHNDEFCFNPWCDQPATVNMTVFNRPIGRTCEICAAAFTTTGERAAATMAIVRDLAAAAPYSTPGAGCCKFCGWHESRIGGPHNPATCLWSRAREVTAQGDPQ